MKIFLNNKMIDLPNEMMTLADLVKFKDIPLQGTAIAMDNKLIKKDKWSVTSLSDLCRITVISASFGG